MPTVYEVHSIEFNTTDKPLVIKHTNMQNVHLAHKLYTHHIDIQVWTVSMTISNARAPI